jgi:hypothetical protein
MELVMEKGEVVSNHRIEQPGDRLKMNGDDRVARALVEGAALRSRKPAVVFSPGTVDRKQRKRAFRWQLKAVLILVLTIVNVIGWSVILYAAWAE